MKKNSLMYVSKYQNPDPDPKLSKPWTDFVPELDGGPIGAFMEFSP